MKCFEDMSYHDHDQTSRAERCGFERASHPATLLWEASRKYCEKTGEQNKLMLTFVFWSAERQPELREQFEKDCASQGLRTS
jgi:hypothetical protein